MNQLGRSLPTSRLESRCYQTCCRAEGLALRVMSRRPCTVSLTTTAFSAQRGTLLPAWLPRLRSPIYRCERVECLFGPLRAAPCRKSSSNFRRVSAIALPPHRRCVHGRKGSPRCSARLLIEAGRGVSQSVGNHLRMHRTDIGPYSQPTERPPASTQAPCGGTRPVMSYARPSFS